MNDLAGFTSLAEKTDENAPERLLTYGTSTTTTQPSNDRPSRVLQQRGPGLVVTPALDVGAYLNVKLATPFVPSLNFTTSWRLVPAQLLLVFHA